MSSTVLGILMILVFICIVVLECMVVAIVIRELVECIELRMWDGIIFFSTMTLLSLCIIGITLVFMLWVISSSNH